MSWGMASGGSEGKNNQSSSLAAGANSVALSVIGAGAVTVGKLVAVGPIEVHGQFQGDIETPGSVFVGESGSVDGAIKAESVTVRGRVTGTVTAKDVVRLAKTAKVNAELSAGQLEMEAGAELIGGCSVSGVSASNVDAIRATSTKIVSAK